MKTYNSLSKISFLKKYSYKFLFVAFIGIHVPLLGILFYTLFVSEISTLTIILVILGLTLLATALTLKTLNNLLDPIIKGKIALHEYVEEKRVPQLPTHYNDEVGEVLRNIQHTIERLDAVSKEKDEVAELISHDLKTPLHQSLSIIRLLKEEGSDPAFRTEYLDILESIVVKQNDFLEGMLRILKSKNIEIESANFEEISVAKMVASVVSDQRKNISNKILIIEQTISDDLLVKGHRQALHEVFSNLLSNAIKFSRTDGIIEFNARENQKTLTIEVKDYGLGFSDKTKSNLFKKFVAGHEGSDGEPSTGLGLYLSKSIIEKHHGTITAFSAGTDQGAIMTVILPLYT